MSHTGLRPCPAQIDVTSAAGDAGPEEEEEELQVMLSADHLLRVMFCRALSFPQALSPAGRRPLTFV